MRLMLHEDQLLESGGRADWALMPRRHDLPQRPDPALAALLRQLREARGVTQEELACRAGLTMSALSRIERGLNRPAWETVARISRALGVSLVELGIALEETQPQR